MSRFSKYLKKQSSMHNQSHTTKLSMESLEQRIVLSSNPVLDPLADISINEGGSFTVPFSFSDAVESGGGGTSVGLDPAAFTSLGNFAPTSNVLIDTTTGAMTGGFVATGEITTLASGHEAMVFTFDDFTLSSGLEITAVGSRPVALLANGDMSIVGNIDVSPQVTGNTTFNDDRYIPGAGGGDGGIAGSLLGKTALGAPLNSRGNVLSSTGGSGGAFGGNGGDSSYPGGTLGGGTAYGDLVLNGIQGGSGGAAASNSTAAGTPQGGDGGGGIELGASGIISISGSILATGGNATQIGNPSTGAGGGAGGGIFVHGLDVQVSGTLSADGGDNYSASHAGGGGGGGRIIVAEDLGGTQNIANVTGATITADGGGTVNAQFNGSDGVIDTTVTYASAPIVETYMYEIVWGDGSSESGSQANSEITVTTGSPGGADTIGVFGGMHSYVDDGLYTVTVTVSDSGGGSVVDTFDVTVNNVAPNNLVLSATPIIDENGVATLDVSFEDAGVLDSHDVNIVWGDGTSETVSLIVGDRTGSFTHQYLDDAPSGTASDDYTVTVTIADDDLDAGSDTATITVNNVVPIITSLVSSSPSVGGAQQGEIVTLTANFSDVGSLDTHSASIDWGDGTTSVGVVDQLTGSVSADHVYSQGGFYDVTLTLTDDDTGEAVDQTAGVIAGLGLHDGALQFIGTNDDDCLEITKSFFSNNLKVQYRLGNGPAQSATYDLAGVDDLEAYLGDGNDTALVALWVQLDSTLFGGGGHDMLIGGGGNDALIGGDGDDTLIELSGRNLLIGGDGADLLIGGSSDDILIAGTTSFDDNLSAIDSIMAEWTSSHDYQTRVANLTQQGLNPEAADRQNGDVFLIADVTVFDDDDVDLLIGGRGLDLYFANLEGGTEDFIVGLKNAEFVEELEIV